jgi:hypothetical protein
MHHLIANRREDFGKQIEAAHFMEPLLIEQGSRMNMNKSRFMYYGASELPDGMKEAIKEAGLKFVSRDSTMEGEVRRQHYIHGVPVGPNSDGIATLVLQDAVDKAKSLKKITLLPVQDAMVVLRKTAAALMNYITRCCAPYEAKAATEHFDEEVLKYLCEIQRIKRNESYSTYCRGIA